MGTVAFSFLFLFLLPILIDRFPRTQREKRNREGGWHLSDLGQLSRKTENPYIHMRGRSEREFSLDYTHRCYIPVQSELYRLFLFGLRYVEPKSLAENQWKQRNICLAEIWQHRKAFPTSVLKCNSWTDTNTPVSVGITWTERLRPTKKKT